MAYSEVAISGYNTNPPPDDGSVGFANQVSWSKIKTKLFDPIRDAFDTINANIGSAVTTAETAVATLEAESTTLASNAAGLATALKAPNGTQMLFHQTTPPTGWTKGTDLDGYALRFVTGDASTGGSTAFTSVLTSRTITSANLPEHSHSFSDSSRAMSVTNGTGLVYDVTDSNQSASAGGVSTLESVNNSNVTVTATYPSFSVTSSTTGSGTAMDFAIQYVDCIYATRS